MALMQAHESRETTAAPSSVGNRHLNAAMGYRHPYNDGSSASANYYYCAATPRPAAFRAGQPAGPSSQLDVIEYSYLSDESGGPRPAPAVAVPNGNAFGTPPPPRWTPAVEQQVVPDAAVQGPAAASSGSAAAVVTTEGSTTIATDRIAFRMRSDEEVLDDGYKWRKYGKKSVKNSPNPRNYYRCSTEGCNVKKRVERDRDDPRYVVTMYEGVHNHVSPGTIYYATQDAASGRFFVSGMQQHHPGP